MFLTKDVGLDIKGIESTKGVVEVYIAAFNNEDSDGDVIRPGSYLKTIKERGPSGQNRVKHLKNHDTRLAPGRVMELYEDSKGLVMVSQLSKSTLGRDTLIEYEEGIITEHSHGLEAIQSNKMEGGLREITEVKLWEGSTLTAWGANPMTPTIGIKSAEDILTELERLFKDGKFTDEYFKRLERFYNDVKTHHSTEPQPHSGEPDAVSAKSISDYINYKS